MAAGYLPDSFGHIPQLPQILQGFGIEAAFIMRGADSAVEQAGALDFMWEAPDGSRVFTHVMQTGYCSGALLSDDPAHVSFPIAELQNRGRLPQDAFPIEALIRLIGELSSSTTLLLPNGCDHLGPQADVLEVIARLNAKLPDASLQQGDLSEYVDAAASCEPASSNQYSAECTQRGCISNRETLSSKRCWSSMPNR